MKNLIIRGDIKKDIDEINLIYILLKKKEFYALSNLVNVKEKTIVKILNNFKKIGFK